MTELMLDLSHRSSSRTKRSLSIGLNRKLKKLLCIQDITRFRDVQRTNSVGLRSSVVRMLTSGGMIVTVKIDILSSATSIFNTKQHSGAIGGDQPP